MMRGCGYQIGVTNRDGQIVGRMEGEYDLQNAEQQLEVLELTILAVGFSPTRERLVQSSADPVRRKSR